MAPEVVAEAPAEAPAAEAEVAAAPAGKGRKQHTPVEGEEELTLPTDGTRIKKPVRPDDSDVRKAIDALQVGTGQEMGGRCSSVGHARQPRLMWRS